MIDIYSLQCWHELRNNSKAQLIDVRSSAEWTETGIANLNEHNKNVKLITWMFFTPKTCLNNQFVQELNKEFSDKSVPLYFICRSGIRSNQAAIAAKDNGFINCYNVVDGFINGWIGDGLPIIKYD